MCWGYPELLIWAENGLPFTFSFSNNLLRWNLHNKINHFTVKNAVAFSTFKMSSSTHFHHSKVKLLNNKKNKQTKHLLPLSRLPPFYLMSLWVYLSDNLWPFMSGFFFDIFDVHPHNISTSFLSMDNNIISYG